MLCAGYIFRSHSAIKIEILELSQCLVHMILINKGNYYFYLV